MLTITKSKHYSGARLIYRKETLIATVLSETPTRANNRKCRYNICWLTGRVEWFDTFAELKNYVNAISC